MDSALNMAAKSELEMSELGPATQMLRRIEEGQVGFNATLQGPYGAKRSTFLSVDVESYLLFST